MNKKGQGEIVFYIIMFVLLFAIVVFGSMKLDQYSANKVQTENCRLMASNGHQTHIEDAHIFGLKYKDCYVETKDGNSVPYDRFRSIE